MGDKRFFICRYLGTLGVSVLLELNAIIQEFLIRFPFREKMA